MRNNGVLICFIFLVPMLGGCVGITKIFPESTVKSQQEDFAQTFIKEGQEHENDGDLVEALKKYEIALAVSPHNKLAIERFYACHC